MFVSYLIKSYLLIILYKSVAFVSTHPVLHSHCNYTIDRIDAITNFTNGSLFVSSGQNYWLLYSHEKPIHSNAQQISDLLPNVSTVSAAVNMKFKADRVNKNCISVNEQIIFYTQTENETVINIYEDNQWSVKRDVMEIDIFSAAKSINWSQPIDALGTFGDIAVIFQGDYYTSIRCESGQWVEVRHLSIPASFSEIKGPLDSANFIKTQTMLDDAYLYMFKGNEFYVCPIFGSDPCSGALSIVADFFHFDDECGFNPKTMGAGVWLWIIILIIVILLVLVLLGLCCYVLLLRSRQITFWVNRRRSKDRNQGLTYEALNGQTDGTVKGTEMKVQTTNGNNGVENNLDDQTNTPFIDSNGKDEELKH